MLKQLEFKQIMTSGALFVGFLIFVFAKRWPEPTAFIAFMVGLSLGYVARWIERRAKGATTV